MLQQPNFFYGQCPARPNDPSTKFYLFASFGLNFMISSVVVPIVGFLRIYLITKIKNRNLKTLIYTIERTLAMKKLISICLFPAVTITFRTKCDEHTFLTTKQLFLLNGIFKTVFYKVPFDLV